MRRNHNVERTLGWHLWRSMPRPKYIVPPKSVIRLTKKDADMDEDLAIGDTFRVGYYSRQDGPNVVWLVDDGGDYLQTWDQQSLLDYFEILEPSDETDTYGTYRPKLGPR